MIYSKLAALLAVLCFGTLGANATAALVSVNTSGDTETSYVVNDPDVGEYTVTISGHSGKAEKDGNYYYRTSSSRDPIDDTWQIAITGLDAGEYISDFVMNTTRIAPSVGGGSDWDWSIEFSADLAGGGTYTDTRVLNNGQVTVDPDIAFSAAVAGDHFGQDPTFYVNVVKNVASNTRAVGWRDFDITAARVPEPSTWCMLCLGMAGLGGLLRRRRA
ncbi:PEP-CTERM sorting domain-containing protein [Aeoliella mucimassa]|uniref:PEP-CTERM motif protein n=1 Tax=Aeoliella mucimassa TaxID=2527972 RepID=A0A518APB9_9BACT|nr:PEP-CTERM sorting domain-containing protein [Aeoliella mucimassa]QDU56551.1 PEP-CTERM motif protein [Aeoliella mucimassa]